ncbi:MAG: hypothetical protein JNJ46_17745 [Myxococcales bacterium]|nr:hypothetical protein [Myxococcales bacterium]
MSDKYTSGTMYEFDFQLPVFHPPRALYAGNFDEHFIQATVTDGNGSFIRQIYENLDSASPHWKLLKNNESRFPFYINLSKSSETVAIPFGALVGLAADHYESSEDLYYTSNRELNANMWVVKHALEIEKLLREPKHFTPEMDAVRRYFRLLLSNYDHFNNDLGALKRFRKEMAKALSVAKDSFNTRDLAAAQELYHQSLVYCAFACHFLTDCFSAGHMRTPRRNVVKACTKIYGHDTFDLSIVLSAVPIFIRKDELIGALYALAAHDIDSRNGLIVDSFHPENQEKVRYIAKGDGFIKESKDGIWLANKSVQCALLAIYQMRFFGRCDYSPETGSGGGPDNPELYIPTVWSGNVPSPLFSTDDASVDGLLWQVTSEERKKTSQYGVLKLAIRLYSLRSG